MSSAVTPTKSDVCCSSCRSYLGSQLLVWFSPRMFLMF
jgi:hypothetical protein